LKNSGIPQNQWWDSTQADTHLESMRSLARGRFYRAFGVYAHRIHNEAPLVRNGRARGASLDPHDGAQADEAPPRAPRRHAASMGPLPRTLAQSAEPSLDELESFRAFKAKLPAPLRAEYDLLHEARRPAAPGGEDGPAPITTLREIRRVPRGGARRRKHNRAEGRMEEP